MNEWADELYGTRIIAVNSSHGRAMNFSPTIWLTLRKDVDFILFTPYFIYFITIYFLKRRSGQYQNKAEDSVFNYLFQGRPSYANAAWARSSKQKHFFLGLFSLKVLNRVHEAYIDKGWILGFIF